MLSFSWEGSEQTLSPHPWAQHVTVDSNPYDFRLKENFKLFENLELGWGFWVADATQSPERKRH